MRACGVVSRAFGRRLAASAAQIDPQKREHILERLRKREERLKERRGGVLTNAMEAGGLTSFDKMLAQDGYDTLRRQDTATVQVNIGLLCNQTCTHCHVEAGPARVLENMDRATVDRVIALIDATGKSVQTVDITGGAPEMNKNFKYLVQEVRSRGIKVIDRCNLTVLHEPDQEDTAEFLAENGVEVVASMPCYSADNVDAQRGDGVFDKSISSLQKLNSVGYGIEGSGLNLHLVYNPGGPFLPGPQEQLEVAYKEKLMEVFGISFNSLFCITNLPVKRFADDLAKEGKLTEYMKLLVDSYNVATVEGLMCLNHVSVRWDGMLFDCDFNQQLDMSIGVEGAASAPTDKPTLWNVDTLNSLRGASVVTGPHCYGCTAGSGSSCGGEVA